MPGLVLNPRSEAHLWASCPSHGPIAFHRTLPGYAPTRLRTATSAARELGIRQLLVKDESDRLGLPAFKILGASWAIARTLQERFGLLSVEACDLDTLRRHAALDGQLRLVAATDGNHGRGVARMGRLLGLPAQIFVPNGTARSRIEAIEAEGATVTIVPGTYDHTIDVAQRAAQREGLLIQDHAWPGYEQIPAWVAEGYATIFWEIEEQLVANGMPQPDIVLVQIGVGALAAAVVQHYRSAAVSAPPVIVGVEPIHAACAAAACEAGRIVSIPAGADASIMAGLNCGTVSSAAWPILERGIDAFVAVEDDTARAAMRLLARDGTVSGESGAAGLAGLVALLRDDDTRYFHSRLRLSREAVALVISTEGATDADAFLRIVGEGPCSVTAGRRRDGEPI